MGEIADGLIDGTFDSLTGEYLGEGGGYPRTQYAQKRKSENLSWQKVPSTMQTLGIKKHLFPQVVKAYGCKYGGKSPFRNACIEILKDFNKFKKWLFCSEFCNEEIKTKQVNP